ncbi:MAG: GGDEF domain-containing protein [Planctomycetota bacterium]
MLALVIDLTGYAYVLVDALIALSALVAGFYGSRYLSNAKHAPTETPEQKRAAEQQQRQVANDHERANMAAFQIRDLAMNVASDVDEHNTLVKSISSELDAMKGKGSSDDVLSAVGRILSANETLESRLAAAEQKISMQAEELKVQQAEARTDALTGLANRRAFDDVLRNGVSSSIDSGNPLSLLIFDVDHFKKFNDTHGHQAGDAVLRALGETLPKVVKSTDTPCRYGGEEFAIILGGTKLSEANVAAERVRKAIQTIEVEHEGKTLHVTISVGVAQLERGETSINLIRRADEGVYASKEAGRNQTHYNYQGECRHVGEPIEPPKAQAQPEEAAESGQADTGNPAGLANLDDLPDRSVYSDELRRRISEGRRFGLALSVVRFKVREYAKIEAEYGSAVGKLILESVAQFIRGTLRDMDLVARFEPGEFGVMLPGSTTSDAEHVANRVSRAIANCTLPLGGKDLRLAVHWGASEFQPEDDPATMLARAENAMQESIFKEQAETLV